MGPSDAAGADRADGPSADSPADDESLPLIGWREWVSLPDLGVESIKAKVDTGARTSALHAFDIEEVERDGRPHIRFRIHPEQRVDEPEIEVELPLIDRRTVRDSGGRARTRPVVEARVEWMGRTWPIELTLTRRDLMGFRMLLGREAIRGRFTVDPGGSFYGGRRIRGSRKLSRRRRSRNG